MTLNLFGTTFHTATAAEILATAAASPRSRARLVVTANVDHIVILSENAAFRKAYDGAAARTLDGTPLVWLARLTGARNARRVTGHDLLAAAMAGPQPADRRVFLLSSTDEVGERVARYFVSAGLEPDAVRSETPPFGFERDDHFSEGLAARIRAHGTTLLVMGVGAPKSEIWTDRFSAELGDPVVLAIGDALNVASGVAPRAPVLLQRLGLEWFFRFLHAPRRLFHRYFLRSWRFLLILATSRGGDRPGSVSDRVCVDGSWVLQPEPKD